MSPTFSRPPRSGKALLRWLIILFILAASIVGVWFLIRQVDLGDEESGPTMHIVKKAEFLNEVTERGDIESASNVEVRCEIKSRGRGGATILWIIPEGTYVNPGDKLVEFDASAFESDLNQQQIAYSNSEASKTKAENDLKDAKDALNEYNEGTYELEKMAIEIKMFTAEEDQRQAQQKVEYTKELERKGYVTSLRLEKDQFAMEKAKRDYASAVLEMKVLEKYKQPKMLSKLNSDIKTAEANLESAKAKCKLDLDELELIKTQIAKCVVYAKESGQVVYANETNRHGGQEIIIEEGTTVREQQVIIRLPDPQRMQVKAKINESKVTLVEEGQRVLISLDAMRDVTLEGVVEKVDEYPAPAAWWGGSVKQYQTYIRIINSSVPLKPGLTAKIQIEVEHIPDCIKIPVQALFEHGDKFYCVKRDPKKPKGWVAHEIEIGSSNDKFVVVTSGLQAGDEIVHGAFAYREKVDLPKLDPSKEKAKRKRPANSQIQPSSDRREPASPNAEKPNTEKPSAEKQNPFKEMDKNGDGKLAKDEVPSQMQPMFDNTDLNSDGFIDQSEWSKLEAKLKAMRRRMQEGGGGVPGAGGRPRPGGGGRP